MMKKLFSLLMVVCLILSLATVAFAEDETESEEPDVFETFVGVELNEYNYGGILPVTFVTQFDNIPEEANGISVFTFAFRYDPSILTPDVAGAEDEDGVECDFGSLVKGLPEGWESFGRIDNENGIFELAFWDNMSGNVIVNNEENRPAVTVEAPFRVATDADANVIEVELADETFYSADLSITYGPFFNTFTYYRALQPDVLEVLPEDALPLDIAGYKHAANNVIYYAEQDITVGDYISSYIETDNGQDDMNYFAIAIVNGETNEIVAVDTLIGRPQSDKSKTVIPAGHYIIGVNGNKQAELQKFIDEVEVGKFIRIYNVNLEPTGLTDEGRELKDAGFKIYSPKPVLTPDAPAVYDEEKEVIYVYENGVSADSFADMFENDVTVTDGLGNELGSDGKIATGTLVNETVRVILIGDVNGDGVIDQYDYILVKRHYLETYELTGDCLKAACIQNGETVEVYDYIYVKRIYFETLKPEALMHLNEVK